MSHRFLSTLLMIAAATGTVGTIPQAGYADEVPESLTIAQSNSTATGSLSVTGTSQVSVPADQAVIVLTYYPNSYYDYSEDPSATSQSPQVLSSDLKMVTDAVTAAGVSASNVKAYPDFTSPGSMRVRLVLDQPTQTNIEQLINDVNTAVVKGNRFTSSGVVVGYTVQDCQAVENQARQTAMTDAQNRAAALANIAGRELGQVYSLSESVSWGTSYLPNCPNSADSSVYSDIYSLPTYDPGAPATVRVVYSLSVTYDMK